MTVPVTPQDDDIVDGTQFPTITASAPGFDPVTETIAVNDDDVAELSIEPAPGAAVDSNGNPIVDEGGEPLDAIEITRSGPTDQPLTVTLASDDETEATVPATVTIPAGQSSVTVPVTPQDDDIVDGTQFPTITASAPGFDPVTETIAVNDDDVAELSIEPAPGAAVDGNGNPIVDEGGEPLDAIEITRSGPTDQPLTVTLASDDETEATVPATVTIPAGQSSVTVPVTPQDDDIVDGTQFPTITASAPGFDPVTETIAVNDDDVEPVVCTFDVPDGTEVDENGVPVTKENGDPITVILSRSGPTDQPLEVTLASSDTSEATVPATVTIPAGQSSVEFLVTPADDNEVDGPQFPEITASGSNIVPVTGTIRVNDDDETAPELSIEPAPGAAVDGNGNPIVDEGGEPLDAIEITRSGPTDQPLTVTLASDDETEATVPATVTIPAGQSSVTVPVTPQDDDIVDGTQFPTITASAPGFDPVTETIAVNDDDVANSAPVANDDPGNTTDSVTPIELDVLGNDTDADGDALTASNPVLNDPALGTVEVVNNKVVYTPSQAACRHYC